MSRKLFALSIILVVIMTGCIKKNNNNANLANPASVYCKDNGGKLEIRTASDGSQSGVCIFDDGSECDEWAYFRGECQPGTVKPEGSVNSVKPIFSNDAVLPESGVLPAKSLDMVYCEDLVGNFEVRPVDDDGWTGNCSLPEKNTCNALPFSWGECKTADPVMEDLLN